MEFLPQNTMEVPEKIKNETTLKLSDPTSSCLSEEAENMNSQEYVHSHAHCSAIYDNSQAMETTQVPLNRRVDKKLVHTYNRMNITQPKPRIKSFLVFKYPTFELKMAHLLSFKS